MIYLKKDVIILAFFVEHEVQPLDWFELSWIEHERLPLELG